MTGIVSVGDDGGSSGRLRAELGIAAPGDIRRCISALAREDSLLSRSLEYRFDEGGLTGHPVGNLLLTGLAKACGDFQQAIEELCRLVDADGSLFPATSVPVRLIADADEGTITGQVTIERATNIRNLRFDPADPPVAVDAADAVAKADQVIVGPGSLYTSVLACAVVPGIQQALAATDGREDLRRQRRQREGNGSWLRSRRAPRCSRTARRADRSGRRRCWSPRVEIDSVDVVWADVAASDGWGHDATKLGAALAAAVR